MIIGAAFGKIVSALVENVLMPPIGFLLKGVDFKDLAVNMGTAQNPVLIKYGVFLQTLIDFTIIAFVLFLVIKGMITLKKRFETRSGRRAAQADAVRDLPQGDPRRAGEEIAGGPAGAGELFHVKHERSAAFTGIARRRLTRRAAAAAEHAELRAVRVAELDGAGGEHAAVGLAGRRQRGAHLEGRVVGDQRAGHDGRPLRAPGA